ncbi:DNA replication factor C, large subunit [Mycena rosella]|uniref:Replication factor C subunit 1 n=1 Tax=Mycena rosella TaxID=1033263 RepID=A0AAD7GL02_MYCRO|nr:DNA replication factor C, large subunit [Mycena rosella]
MAPSQKSAKTSQPGKDIRAFFGGSSSQKQIPTPKPTQVQQANSSRTAIEISDDDEDMPLAPVKKATSSTPSLAAEKPTPSSSKPPPKLAAEKPTPSSSKPAPKLQVEKAGPRKSDAPVLKPMDVDSDDEPAPKKRKKATALLSSDDEDTPPKKKPATGGSKSKPRLSGASSDDEDSPPSKKITRKTSAPMLLSGDDEDKPPKKKKVAAKPRLSKSKKDDDFMSDDDEPAPKKSVTKVKPRLSKSKADDDFVVSDDDEPAPKKSATKVKPRLSKIKADDDFVVSDDEPAPKKSATKVKPRLSKSKADDDFVVSDDDEPTPKKSAAKAKAGPSKVSDKTNGKGATNGKEKVKDEPPKHNWAAAKAAKLAGPVAHGTKDVPDGAPNCLAGLAFVFTGELSSFSRDEAVDIAKRFGGRVTGGPSGKTDYVVLGDNAGPSKLTVIKKHGLKTLNEDEFLKLIATRKGSGKVDEKTAKKIEKEEEAIKMAAKEMQKREKDAAKEQSTSNIKAVDPSSQLWTTRYAPQNLKEICGNKGQVEKLQQWLKDWPSSLKSGFKKPGKNGMNIFRAILITGPPGIGKTTSAHMVAKLEGFTPIELNASDARSKKLVENGMNVNNTSLDGYIAGSAERDGVKITDRTVLIMDEVDGMSSGDRGGVGALNAMIKKSKVPIICIANDRGAQKLKPLVATTYSLTFQRPTAAMIRSRLMTIAFKEKMKIPGNALDQLVAGSQSDIRQILNMMSTWRLSSDTMDFDEGKTLAKMNEKYTIMSPFDITSKMLGPYLFSSTSRETLGDKMELYFQDHSFMPLFIQENYLKTVPSQLRNYDGPMKQIKALELMDKAASSISDGDLVDALIHGPEQHWALMPLHAVCSTVRPASFQYGMGAHYGGPNSMSFPQWLGQNSKQTKLSRQLGDVQIRMRLKVSGDKSEIRQSYIPALFPHIIRPLMDVGASVVEDIIEKMDEYYLTKEDWDTIVELGVDDKKDDLVLKKISTATKTTLTKKYNAAQHPIPFYKATDLGKVPKKLAGGPAPDIEDAFDVSPKVMRDVG